MQSDMLRRAREYEAEKRPEIRSRLPLYHLTGGVGWINDPNGFSLYQGWVHLFFQYYPYDVTWGPMHWGHARSKDFLHWEFLPAAMAPDMPYDKDGCFSGSAAQMPDGRHLLLYTGVMKEEQAGVVHEYQTQCVAFGDGLNYEKAAQNPVIDSKLLPEGSSKQDFRDPKLWYEDGRWHAVAANLAPGDNGCIRLFESEDALSWRYVSTIAESFGRLGKMWECPDFFRLDGKAVLIHSAHEMQAEGLEFHPGDGTVCHIGQYDSVNNKLLDERIQAVDYGLDFYAPQSLEMPDGRRILVGWMQSWAAAHYQPDGFRFYGQMTIPRELSIRNGRLYQWPVHELDACRGEFTAYHTVPVTEPVSLPGVQGRVLDLELTVRGEYRRFSIRIAVGGGRYTELLLLPEENMIRMDRRYSGFAQDVIHLREMPADFSGGKLNMRLILDRWSAELFVNGGEQAASLTFYTPLEADEIVFSAKGEAILDVGKYELCLE